MGMYHIAEEAHFGNLAQLHGAETVIVTLKIIGEDEANPYQSRPALMYLMQGQDVFVLELSKIDVSKALSELFTSPQVTKVFRRAKPAIKQLFHHYQIRTQNVFCCALASQLLAMGNRREKAMLAERVAEIREGFRVVDQMSFDIRAPLNAETFQMAQAEIGLTQKLHHQLAEDLVKAKLKRVSSLEFRTVLPVAAMELRGIYADRQRLNEARQQIETDMDGIQSDLLRELRGPEALPGLEILNLNSPEQVKFALHSRGIMVQDTAESRLRPYVAKFPFIGQLLEYRRLSRLLASVTSQLANFIQPDTGRIHATYHQISSSSGRFACSNPNIQQIPREAFVRSCIRAEQGNCFIVADYSQVELRVAAGLSKDALMLKAYSENGDLHKLTAAITMGKPADQVTKAERQAAKAINFGLIYAMGARGLQQSAQSSYGVAMSLEEAQLFRQRYFENYRGIQKWQKDTEHFGRKNGYVRTAAGRIRSYRDEALRVTELLNTPVQGTAAEGLKSALCIFGDEVERLGLNAAIVAIIHDEIIVEVQADQAEKTKGVLEKAMVDGIAWLVPNVPFTVDAAIADSWADK